MSYDIWTYITVNIIFTTDDDFYSQSSDSAYVLDL